MEKYKTGLVQEYHEKLEYEKHQEELKKKHNIEDENIVVVEKDMTQNSQDLRLRRPFPGPRTSSQEGGNLFETDTTQWTLRQAWHL